MSLQNEEGNPVIIIAEGRIDLSNSHLLKDKLLEIYDQGTKIITLDFSLVTGIDSSGLGQLLLFQKKLKERGGRLRIIRITSEHIRKMFNMIHLYKVIEIE